jgi:F-type H+-transporting ATPase subunit epsilon
MATMHVEVVSAEQHVLSADVTELYARSVEGDIGILPGHQPAVVALDIGPVRVKLEDGSEELIAVHHGVLYVEQGGKVIVLADIAEPASAVDVSRARARRDELQRRLDEGGEDVVLRQALRKQELRLQVAEQA